MADLALMVERDRRASAAARKDAEKHLERVFEVAQDIRRMTELYRERLEGKRVVQP